MAFLITNRNKSLSSQIGINPQAILQIEGLKTVFGSQPVLEFARWDANVYWDDGTRWDGYVKKESSLDVIDLGGGTSNKITQQVYPDKSSSGSISTVNVALVDTNNEVAQILSFDNITEILGKKADFYIGFKQGAFPEDAIPVFRGVVVDFYTQNGTVMISIAHPDTLKRQEIYEQYISQLTQNLKYQQSEIQGITYKQRDPSKPTLSVEYITTGVAVDLALDVIRVNVNALPTAKDVVEAIRDTASVNFAVAVELTGSESTPQTPFAPTPLSVDTIINVGNTEGLFLPQDELVTYVLVNEELMKVIDKTDTTIQVERAQFNTLGKTAESEDEILSQYRLKGNPIDLALKLMLSGVDYFLSDDKPKKIESNNLIFDYYDIKELTGLVVGDKVRLTGANNGEYTIKDFNTNINGSSIEIEEILIDASIFTGTFEYKSQYNVLPDGLGMLPFNVDVQGHLDVIAFNPGLFTEYEIDFKQTIEDAKKLIEEQIYFPQGLYSIPRKARSSVKLVLPPLSSEILPTLNTRNITNLSSLKQRRSIHKYLYNIFRYDYELDEIEDKYKRKEILVNNSSKKRIKAGNKVLKVKANGLRDNPITLNLIQNIMQRYKDRFSSAPVYFEGVNIKYSNGFNIEVGDVLPFGGEDTKVVDLQTGKRNQVKNLYEVINKSLSIKTGEIKIDLLQTSFNINARYAVFSMSSLVVSGTTNSLTIGRIIDTGEFENETDKWADFSGIQIRVRSKDYTYDEVATLISVDSQNNEKLIIDALPTPPPNDSIIEIPLYDNSSQQINDELKLRFSHMTFRGIISAVVSDSVFELSDINGIFVGSRVVVSSLDYTRDSFGETYEVDDITGNQITLNKSLPFTPIIGDKVENSNFGDDGFPYQLL